MRTSIHAHVLQELKDHRSDMLGTQVCMFGMPMCMEFIHSHRQALDTYCG